MGQAEYINHLYSDDLDGYIQIATFEGSRVKSIKHARKSKGIKKIAGEQEGQNDTYITPNSFYIPERRGGNIRHLRALYIDLDVEKDSIYSKTEAHYHIYMLVAQGKIPKPSMIIDSGRGLHLYWRIEHAPKGALYTWQQLQDYLYRQLKGLGADIQATDSTRLLRVPNTVNSKNGATCEVLEDNNIQYSMYDLRKEYLNYEKKETKGKSSKKKSTKKVKNIFNSYTLHYARARDIETIVELRNYQVKGFRNSLLHCYCYWQGIYVRESRELYNIVHELNSQFVFPLKDSEIRAIVRSTERAIDDFIEYEQGIRSGEDKRVSKAMKERGGYWYTNETLLDMLDITLEEQGHLKTIISTREKLNRRNRVKRKARRNKNGLTEREQSKFDNIQKVKKLSEKKLTQLEIAKELDITQQYVSKILDILK